VSDYRKQGAKANAKARSILVKGDTKEVKMQLMGMNGSWNKGLVGWIFPIAKKEQVIRVLRADPTNEITVDKGDDDGESSEVDEEDEEDEEDVDEDGLGFVVRDDDEDDDDVIDDEVPAVKIKSEFVRPANGPNGPSSKRVKREKE